jgi:D-amino peptidase
MKRFVLACLALALSTGPAQAQRKLKVFISADMEGVGGVTSWSGQAMPDAKDYGVARKLMAHEVNAAVAGAFDAGATEVLVADGHGPMTNIDPELLDKRARLVRGFPRPLLMMQGLDNTFDAVVFIGYHAPSQAAETVLAHTISGSMVFELRLGGRAVSEAIFNAAVAGDLDVPVVFLAGDQVITAQTREVLGPIEIATVKQSVGFTAGIMMAPEEAQRLIREGVKRGIDRRAQLTPYKVPHPVRLEIIAKRPDWVELVSWLPGVERRGSAVSVQVPDMAQASRFLAAAIMLRTE